MKLFLINNYISQFGLINFLHIFFPLFKEKIVRFCSSYNAACTYSFIYRSTYLSVCLLISPFFFHLPFLSLSLSPLHHSKAARPLVIRCVLRSCSGSSLIITKILMAPANGFSWETNVSKRISLFPLPFKWSSLFIFLFRVFIPCSRIQKINADSTGWRIILHQADNRLKKKRERNKRVIQFSNS